MNNVDLKELFLGLQRHLSVHLEVNRQCIPHAPTKGDSAEINWLGMLDKHLPSRYQAKKAFVLDCHGTLSDQIDIVIFDRHYCPLLFNQDGALYVPAESVYAVFEVKQTLNKELVEYAAAKAASVRALHRTSAVIPHAGGVYSPKPPFRILAGLLTLGSDWNPGLGEPFASALSNLPPEGQLDLGCCLEHGGFAMTYESGKSPDLKISNQETSLVFFLLRFLHQLQQLGTVPALDLLAYSKDL